MADTGLKRIKYVSRFAREMTVAELDALVAKAAEKNRALGITGILATTGGLFYQVIEGPTAAIDSLYATIAADGRHVDVLVLGVEEGVAQRHFPQWQMHRVDLASPTEPQLEPLRELLATVVELRLRADRLTNTLERGILRRLMGT